MLDICTRHRPSHSCRRPASPVPPTHQTPCTAPAAFRNPSAHGQASTLVALGCVRARLRTGFKGPPAQSLLLSYPVGMCTSRDAGHSSSSWTPSALGPRHPVTGLPTHGISTSSGYIGHSAQLDLLPFSFLHGIVLVFYMPIPPYHAPCSDIFLFLCSLHLHAYARRSEGGLCNGSLYNSDRRLRMYTSVGLRIEISSFTSQSSSDTGPSSPQDTEPSLSARGLSRTLSCSRRGRVSRLFRIIRAPVAVFALVARCSSHDSVVEARRVVQGFLPYGTRSRSGT
ncbi:hypothetical protein EXIGLDRAFT_392202 [Exidia glandulosa HHB12029]|uniref:Uncharacterized protein n=1 Tax=Exidia glandulosa HHB12029 TaxID=1314781 RepID=A0A165BRL0_EXIGL|nr:hypothetical protein EXIGLDRAFT_392202 [Exidia glandulosa HHB12029]